MGLKMCKVTVGSREKAYPDGTPFGEIVKDFDQDCKYPVVLVTVDGKLRELHKKIHRLWYMRSERKGKRFNRSVKYEKRDLSFYDR